MNFAQLIQNITGYINLQKGVRQTIPGIVMAVGILMLFWSKGIALPDALWETRVGMSKSGGACESLVGRADPWTCRAPLDSIIIFGADSARIGGEQAKWRRLDGRRIRRLPTGPDSIVIFGADSTALGRFRSRWQMDSLGSRSLTVGSDSIVIVIGADSASTGRITTKGHRADSIGVEHLMIGPDSIIVVGTAVLGRNGDKLTWRQLDSLRIHRLRGLIRNLAAEKAGYDSRNATRDSIAAHRIKLIADLLAQYKTDISSNSARAFDLRSVVEDLEGELSRSDGRALAGRTQSQFLGEQITQYSADLAFWETEFKRSRENSLFKGAVSSLIDSTIAILLLGFVLGLILTPLGRAMFIQGLFGGWVRLGAYRATVKKTKDGSGVLEEIPRNRAFFAFTGERPPEKPEPRPERLPHRTSYYIGKGIITQDEHEKLISDYYAYAELVGSLVIPLGVLFWASWAIGIPNAVVPAEPGLMRVTGLIVWVLVAFLVCLILLLQAPLRFDIYEDKLREFIRGRIRKIEDAKGDKDATAVSGDGTKYLLANLQKAAHKASRGADSGDLNELRVLIRGLAARAERLKEVLQTRDIDRVLGDFVRLVNRAQAIVDHEDLKKASSDLTGVVNSLLEQARDARRIYAEALAENVLQTRGDGGKKAKAALKKYGEYLGETMRNKLLKLIELETQ